jgi:hypothetical protein
MVKKRKLSDLTSQETEIFIQMINKFKNDLAEDDEEEKSVIGALEHVMMKLQTVNVSLENRFSLFLNELGLVYSIPECRCRHIYQGEDQAWAVDPPIRQARRARSVGPPRRDQPKSTFICYHKASC